MSTKTLRKRIALVAVVALGAGVLATSPASATANNAVGGENVAPVIHLLNLAVASSITGAAIVSSTPEDAATEHNFSLGLLASSTTLTTSSLTSTATMRSDGEIVFYTKTSNDVAATFTVDGGTIGSVAAEGTVFNNINAAKTSYVTGAATASTQIAFSIVPNAGATSVTVSMYESASLATIDATKVASVQSGVTSKGTLVQRYLVTVAATSVSSIYSSAYSFVQAQENVVSAVAAPTTNVDETDSTTIANSASSVGYISFILKDAYNVSLSGKGALVVSATNGAGVALADTTGGYGAAASVTLLSAVSNYASGTVTVARPTAYANKGFSTTVTISWNGAVVGTKTIKFQGEVAKISVTVDAVGQAGATSTGGLIGSVSYQDDAGNVLLPSTGTSAVSTTLNQYVTAVPTFTAPTALDPFSYYDVSCGGTTATGLSAGSADVVLQFVNSVSGSIVKSAPSKITCGGNATTFAASFDKATYAPGDIAVLTLTGKDAQGNAANGIQDWKGAGDTLFAITTPTNLTIVTAISTVSVGFTTGVGIKTYKYIVGTTEGTYNAIVSAPVISANNIAAGGAGVANATVKYTVALSTSVISLADVLKAIVSLIASINKQIAALQKALLKK